MTQAIRKFDGEYRFLSNFVPCRVELDGLVYPSVEHAYQAAKTLDAEQRFVISQCAGPGQAKRMGRRVRIRKDWEAIKLSVMRGLLLQKFMDKNFRYRLLETGNAHLEEGNDWGDTFWGTYKGIGQNKLGILLMEIRAQLRAQFPYLHKESA